MVKEVIGEVFDHFANKFIEDDLNIPVLEGDVFKVLSPEDINFLELPFEEGEIKEAV